jgi:hypothetical protein
VLPFPNFIDTYIIHKHTGGAAAAQFTISADGGSTLSLFQVNAGPDMLLLGDASDLSIAYGGCKTGDIYLVNVRYFGSGNSPACARLTLTPAPTTPIPGQVAAVDCNLPNGNLFVPGTGVAHINPSPTCLCDVAVNTATWGAIKALYR